jgi:HK97 family phage major capsid protein
MTIQQLREKRARAIEQARTLLNQVEAENRSMSAEENQTWGAWMDEADAAKTQIEQRERLEDEERSLEASQGRATSYTRGTSGTFDPNDALRGFFLLGTDQRPTQQQLTAATQAGMTGRTFTFQLGREALRNRNDVDSWERRALGSSPGTAGGHTIAPEFRRELEVALLSFGGMREAASVVRTSTGADLPWPTVNDTDQEGIIVPESGLIPEQDVTFGQKVFKAYKYSSKIIRIPVELLQDVAINLAEEVGTRLGERLGRIGNRHFTVGTGTAQPQGIVTAATQGVIGGSATAVTYDNLVDLQHSVNPSYRPGAQFMFNDITLREIKKLKDSDGRPLWLPGMAVREPDTILGHSYVINQHMLAPAAAVRSILFGALDKYKIRDVLDVVLVRLDERFAEFGQVAFLAYSRHDGALLDAGTNPVKFFRQA